MANQELVNFITNESAAGHSEGEIRTALKGKGWADSDIDMAWSAWKSGQGGSGSQPAAGTVAQPEGRGVGRFIQPSWELLNKMVPSIMELYKLFLLPFILLFAVFIVPMFFRENLARNDMFALGYGIVTLMAVVFFAYMAMWVQATLLLMLRNKGGAESVEQHKESARVFIAPLFWTNLLAGLIIALGLVLLVIPGIYLIICYCVVQNVIVDQGKRGMEALRASRSYVVGQWWAVFYSFIGLMAINILAAIVLDALSKILGDALGSLVQLAANLVLFPYTTIYTYLLYERLKALRPEVAGQQAVVTSAPTPTSTPQ